MFQNILILGHSNIGDIIYDLAVIDPLRQHCPAARVSFLTSARGQDIAAGYHGIDEIIVLNRQGRDKGFLNRLRFTGMLRKKRFDLVVVLKSSLNDLFLGVSAVWRARNPDGLHPQHPVDRYLDMLRSRGVMIKGASFHFSVNDEGLFFCEQFLARHGVLPQDTLIGVLPLAAWSLKSWPAGKWRELAGILRQTWGVKMLNLGKMPDNGLGGRVARELAGSVIPADKTTLPQAQALLNRCQAFIGPDSSLLHLASCMGVETIGLYGATPSDRFYPYFHRHNILMPKNKPACMPCYPGRKPSCCAGPSQRDFGACMDGIAVEDVVSLIQERLNLKS